MNKPIIREYRSRGMSNPLVLQHEKMGAVLDHGAVPLQYTGVAEEYWTVKKAVGLTDLSHLGRLTIRGKDRTAFLNGLLTNDISKLEEGSGIHSALLNTKARVLADLYLYNLDDGLVVDTGDSQSRRIKATLDQFIITEDVQIEDSGENLLQLTLQGPQAAQVLKGVLSVDLQGLHPLSHKAQGPALLIARDRTGAGGYDIIVPRDETEAVWESLLLKGGEFGLSAVGLRALDILRLEKGLPRYGVDVDENTIVLEAGFQDAISFTKGCYMGQEVVARATHIGRVNKRLVQLRVDGTVSPLRGSKLKGDGKEAGFVTSAEFSPGMGKVVALGYAQREFAVEGRGLTVEAGGGELPAVVSKIV